MSSWWCESAWIGDGPVTGVRLVARGGVLTEVTAGVDAQPGETRLAGLTLPGLANAHSHAFHRALRGRTHDEGGTFWTWRQRMYQIAGRLDPDRYLALARATYAEMALAGVTCVGEFHYLHHGPGGTPYDDPNEMGHALRQAAGEAGIRLTLLDACYLAGGLTAEGHLRPDGVQQRFSDGSVSRWAARVADLRGAVGADDRVRVGAAIHSVRAVPRLELTDVAAAFPDAPLHAHLSEQYAENEAALAFYGRTPTELLAGADALGPRTTVVHATVAPDLQLLGSTGTRVCLCPTTERDLADGIGPARLLAHHGSPLCLGSDQNAVIDLFEEARAMEMHERLFTLERGAFQPAELVAALTHQGHAALGWPEAGRLQVGAPADLISVRLDSVRTAGTAAAQALYAATACDVQTVITAGRVMVQDGRHVLGDVARLLREAVQPLWESR